MSMEVIIYLVFGIVSILLEFVLPGAVIGFLGLASVIVAAGIYFGWPYHGIEAVFAWMTISTFLIVVIRTVLLRFIPGNYRKENISEEIDYVGMIVEVTDNIIPSVPGRIRHQGTTWGAESEEVIAKGEKVVIVSRKGLNFIVKKIQ